MVCLDGLHQSNAVTNGISNILWIKFLDYRPALALPRQVMRGVLFNDLRLSTPALPPLELVVVLPPTTAMLE